MVLCELLNNRACDISGDILGIEKIRHVLFDKNSTLLTSYKVSWMLIRANTSAAVSMAADPSISIGTLHYLKRPIRTQQH